MNDFPETEESTEMIYEENSGLGDASLYITATPIGNLGDITYRAVEVLKSVDLIAAEDTRHTLTLLNKLGIKNELISFHEYSDPARVELLISRMLEGKKIALVSDAGMPGISDPGSPLVKACIANNIKMTVVPGACAAVTALPMSGIDARRFTFEGFIPRDKTRKDVIADIVSSRKTVIFYESPHHLVRTLEELNELIPERRLAVCRELTKVYEEVLRYTVSEALEYFISHRPRGEFVIILEGKAEELPVYTEEEMEKYARKFYNGGEKSRRDTADELIRRFGIPKNTAKKLTNGL